MRILRLSKGFIAVEQIVIAEIGPVYDGTLITDKQALYVSFVNGSHRVYTDDDMALVQEALGLYRAGR